jgi:hypothetical protein
VDFSSGTATKEEFPMGGPFLPGKDSGACPIVCDVVAFRKSWAKSNTPTYWVEICFMPRAQVYFIRRHWHLPPMMKKDIPSTGSTKSAMTSSPEGVAEVFQKTVLGVLGKDYTALERTSCQWSPAFKTPLEHIPTPREVRQKIGASLRRKPGKDSW